MAGLLILSGADIYSKDEMGETPLHRATMFGRNKIIKILLEKGANLESRDKNAMTPLILASMHGRKEAAGLLIERGAKINAIPRLRSMRRFLKKLIHEKIKNLAVKRESVYLRNTGM